MRRAGLIPAVAVAACVAVGVTSWRAGANNAAATARPSVVATVDIQKLINGLDELVARQKDFDRFRDELKAKVEAKKKSLDDAEQAVKILPPSSPEMRVKQEEYRRLALEYKFEGEFTVHVIDERRGTIYSAIYRKIAEASARFAKQNGYDLIIANDSKADMPEVAGEEAIRAMIVSRQVVFASEAIDVTADMLAMMNNEFKAGVGGK